jgi:carbamoyltransferase
MLILGISAFYHDSAAVIINGDDIIAAAQEERFTRKKHDSSFPINAIKFCLEFSGQTLNQLDAIVFYDKPFLKFERLLETYHSVAPKGLMSFLTAMPIWIKEKLFLKKIIYDALKSMGNFDKKKVKLLFPEHHLSHAASTFFPSPYEKAAILTIDGVGEWATISICLGEGNTITVIKELHFPDSLGLLYSAVTYYCGFRVNSGEYKLMGLAPYGNAGSSRVNEFVAMIKSELINLKDDGSFFLNQRYFRYTTGLRMADDEKWKKLFGFAKREPENPLEQHHCDLAFAIQKVTEEVVMKLATEAKKLTGVDNLCMAGGVALNCVANGKLLESGIFKKIFITSAPGDAGGALGAAYAAEYIYFKQERKVSSVVPDKLKGSFLGPEYSHLDILKMCRKYKACHEYFSVEEELLAKCAALIAEGKVIGWHQGRMEFGPRALGARSIIADARNPEMQKKLNSKIKYREGFRPFAPIVPIEDVSEYFDHDGASPYMLFVKQVRKDRQMPYPPGYETRSLFDKLYFSRSDIPAVTHIDYSARLQTVHRETNPRLWKLLQAFKKQTGYSVLINTSFNVRGEPIVNSPEEAYRCFMRTGMDYLIIGDYIFDKVKQPVWLEKATWSEERETADGKRQS